MKKNFLDDPGIALPVLTVIIMASVWVGSLTVPENIAGGDDEVLVEKVIDGDTFVIAGEKVRILGINAPDKGECYYKEAGEVLKKLINGKVVRLDKDREDRDKYGRLLRYVFLEKEGEDNMLINDYLVRQGFAFEYHIAPNSRYKDLLVAAREEAKRAGRGLWGACDYQKDEVLRSADEGPTNPDCIIKGNISEKSFGKTYLVPGCDNYGRVKIDTSKGEAYFCTESEAEKAGFRKATNCP